MFKKLLTNPAKEQNCEHISLEVRTMVARGERITFKQFHLFPMNSYERELLYPFLDNDALCQTAEYFVKNSLIDHKRPCSTYNDALIAILVPEMIKRIRELNT